MRSSPCLEGPCRCAPGRVLARLGPTSTGTGTTTPDGGPAREVARTEGRLLAVTRRLIRWCAGLATVVVALAVMTGCGFNATTLQPYHQADGINFQTGDLTQHPDQPVVKVRNVLILADSSGDGFVSASMITDPPVGQLTATSTLTSISGVALKPDGTAGDSLTVGSFSPITIGSDSLVVLTDRAPITVKASDLKPGGTAKLTFTFSGAGSFDVVVPVIDRDNPVYATVSPSANPSASQS